MSPGQGRSPARDRACLCFEKKHGGVALGVPRGLTGLTLGSETTYSQVNFACGECKYMAGLWEKEKTELKEPFTHVPEKQLEKRSLINSNVIQTRCQSQS